MKINTILQILEILESVEEQRKEKWNNLSKELQGVYVSQSLPPDTNFLSAEAAHQASKRIYNKLENETNKAYAAYEYISNLIKEIKESEIKV